tara:strand:- start:879 stop:1493 length:615 start_codon:yes stop_codon:yes gene_type:complete
LRKNKKKFLYIISPNKIEKNFYHYLREILKLNTTSIFQLRLKSYSHKTKINIGHKVKKICRIYKVKLIINDDVILAKELGADGCHLGQSDWHPTKARKILGNKIIGITCHNSVKLVREAIKNNASYIALGAFFNSKTKKIRYKSSLSLIQKVKKLTTKPVVAIGGINHKNYKKILLNHADFIAISGYIWKNKSLNPFDAIKLLK